ASSMSVARFQLFNVIGALWWVLLLVLLGYFFGNIPFIRQYLNVIVLVGIGAAIGRSRPARSRSGTAG
ncbi:hypothetical protein K6Y82_21190, partial [Burkholderia cenocepacia]